jgi:hypothetical protein
MARCACHPLPAYQDKSTPMEKLNVTGHDLLFGFLAHERRIIAWLNF